MKLPSVLRTSAIVLATVLTTPCLSALELTVTNSSSLSNDDIYLWFQDPSGINANFRTGGDPVQGQRSYSLSEFVEGSSGGIDITDFVGGRIYVTTNAPFPAQTSNAIQPQFNQTNPPAVNNSYNNNHQLITEITFDGTGGSANITHIDWASTPAALRNFNSGGTQLKRIGFPETLNVTNYRNDLAALTSGDAVFQAGTNSAGNAPTATTRSGSTSVQPQAPAPGSNVRIVSPTSNLVLSQQGKNTYPSFNNYVTQIIADNPGSSAANPIANLQGKFFSGSTPTYDFTVDSIVQSGSDPSYSFGTVTLTGTVSDMVGTQTIVIPPESFSDVTIYGGDLGSTSNMGGNEEKGIGYILNGVPTSFGENTIWDLPIRDFLAGLNYGYINSIEPNPNDPGNSYGDSASQYWGSLNLITLDPQTFMAFDEVQKDNPFYNLWAAIVHEYSEGQAYGFSFDDTFAQVLIQTGLQDGQNVSRLDIQILEPFYNVIPEPGHYSLGLAAILAIVLLRRRR